MHFIARYCLPTQQDVDDGTCLLSRACLAFTIQRGAMSITWSGLAVLEQILHVQYHII